jgi:DNA-binding transcriptional ArsR family regulator
MSNLEEKDIPLLSDQVPVKMPDLPPRRIVNTLDQYRAISDPTRTRILNIVQLTPATAKQIADRLGASPGAIGHHLHVLEEAGLVQVSARRLVRGIVASYYTRTARLFEFQLPAELAGTEKLMLDIASEAMAERDEARQANQEDICSEAFPHARLSPERAIYYVQRINALVDDLVNEPADGSGDVYGVLISMFRSPPYLQSTPTSNSTTP